MEITFFAISPITVVLFIASFLVGKCRFWLIYPFPLFKFVLICLLHARKKLLFFSSKMSQK